MIAKALSFCRTVKKIGLSGVRWKRWCSILAAFVGLFAPAEFGWCGWRTFTTADGLANTSVSTVLEDRSESIWFGTQDGVSRYDGLTWRAFTKADGLVDNYVTSIVEDRSGNLWFGTLRGVSRYDGFAWRTFTIADGLGADFVVFMLEDHSGNLWFGMQSGGVSRYDGSAWRTFTATDGLVSNNVYSGIEDRSGNLWFGTSEGVSRYDGSAWRTFTTFDGLGDNHVHSIVEDRSGNLWFGTDMGVSRYDGSAWRTFTTVDGLVDNGIHSMVEDRSGNLWFGTRLGVSRYDGRAWRTFTTADGLVDNYVLSVKEDHSGNLWFGTPRNVSRYDGSGWRTFTTGDGLGDNYVHSILKDRSGNLWFGTEVGVSRYDGSTWRTFTTGDGLGDNHVHSIVEDRSGNLWFGTEVGVSRYDGSNWRTFTTADGLGSNYVRSILEDRSGSLWFGTGRGVSRYDGSTWRTFTMTDGLADDYVVSMLEDREGNLWFGTGEDFGGLSRYDGVAWRTFTTADGLGDHYVYSMLEDGSGILWFGTGGGLSRYDGSNWHTFTTADGLGSNLVSSMLEDQSGNLWLGTAAGATRYDGSSWRTFTTSDGLGDNDVQSMVEDRSGNFWFGSIGGASRYEPDRVAPQTSFLSAPPRLTPARDLSAVFVAGFGETDRFEFSARLDGGAWSPWSPISSWFYAALPDGIHRLEGRCRDSLANTDLTPANVTFEIDATPPTPVIQAPSFGQPLRGTVAVLGTTVDARFKSYIVAVRPAGNASWDSLAQSPSQVNNGILANWNTTSFADGLYDLRLSVTDSLFLTGTAQVAVVVDNNFPFAEETTPAVVTAASGGDLFTTKQEVHLYFPPHAFDKDALVSIAQAESESDTLPSGAVQVLPAYDISWGGGTLRKPATMRVAFSGAGSTVAGPRGAFEHLSVYDSAGSSGWERLGGTVGNADVALTITQPGRYALFVESGVISGSGTLGALAFTPSVLSQKGAFADREVGISFTLGRPAPVTVRVYSRSGRLIREVVSGQSMNAGANLVRWDGRDRSGEFAVDGLYLVTVEALGRTERKTLAVVR